MPSAAFEEDLREAGETSFLAMQQAREKGGFVHSGWLPWFRAHKEGMLLGAVAVAGLVVLAVAFASHLPRRWAPKVDRAMPDRVVTPPEKPMHPAESGEAGLSAFSPQMLGEAGRFRRSITVEPPYDMIDSRRFHAGDQLVVLTGIVTPPMDTACENPDRTLWPCGIFARATLYAIIRGEKLTCQSQGLAPDLAPPAGALVGVCRVRGKNVAVELVRLGFARPQGFAPRVMLEAEAEAQAEKRGLWRNEWKMVQRR